MKIIKFYTTTLAVLVLALLLADLPAMAQRNQIQGEGELKSQTRNVSGFKGIDVSGGFAVELTQGSQEGVRIEAQENLLNNIKTEVKNGVLHIYNEGSISTNKGMKAYITVRELNKVDISGGVKVTGKSTFKADAFTLDLSGGSKVTLAINTKKLNADLSGASKVEITGRADEMVMDLSGASSVNMSELEAKTARIDASGASKVRVFAKDRLDINASGASKVEYKGSPQVSSNVSAAAKISKM
ncbi:head GIN domain-containing protein [Pontibacter roseus]|uniref:head GIN domain-containing protein n=1 Tax=Pontibacter roseus TaxID=336989 RepID=UPI0003697570|nr:head GIN domain-containing protein [Pontibacter roseus]